MTDGANNSGSPPREAALLARQEGVPLYIYGVGITSPRDIIVANLFAPDVTFVKDEVPVTVRVRSQGMNGETRPAGSALGNDDGGRAGRHLRRGWRAGGDAEVHAANPGRVRTDRDHRPARRRGGQGQQPRAPAAQGHRQPRSRCCWWSSRRAGSSAICRPCCMRDRRIDLKCFLVEGDPAIARGTNIALPARSFPPRKEDLFKYDLVIFGDVDPRRLPAQNHGEPERTGQQVWRRARRGRRQASSCPQAYRRTALEQHAAGGTRSPTLVEPRRAAERETDPARTDRQRARQPDAAAVATRRRRAPPSGSNCRRSIGWPRWPGPSPPRRCCWWIPIPPGNRASAKCPWWPSSTTASARSCMWARTTPGAGARTSATSITPTLWGQIVQRLTHPAVAGRQQAHPTHHRPAELHDRRARQRLCPALHPGLRTAQGPDGKGVYGLANGSGPRPEVTLRPMPEQPGLYRGGIRRPSPGPISSSSETTRTRRSTSM